MMKHLQLNFDDEKFATDLKGLYATADHYDRVIDDDAVVFNPRGTLLGILIRGRVPNEVQKDALAQLATVNGMPSNRSVAVYRGSRFVDLSARMVIIERQHSQCHSLAARAN